MPTVVTIMTRPSLGEYFWCGLWVNFCSCKVFHSVGSKSRVGSHALLQYVWPRPACWGRSDHRYCRQISCYRGLGRSSLQWKSRALDKKWKQDLKRENCRSTRRSWYLVLVLRSFSQYNYRFSQRAVREDVAWYLDMCLRKVSRVLAGFPQTLHCRSVMMACLDSICLLMSDFRIAVWPHRPQHHFLLISSL